MGLIAKIGLAIPVTVGNIITAGLEKITGKTYGRTTIKEASETTTGKILGTAITGTAAALGATAVGTAGLVAAGKTVGKAAVAQVVKSPVKTLAITGIVAGGGLKLVEPAFKTIKSATQTAVPVLTGEEGLTSGNVSDVVKVVGAAVGLGAVGAAAGVVAEKVLGAKEAAAVAGASEAGMLGSSDVMEEAGIIPAETVDVSTKAKAKRKKTARGAQGQKISQSVRVYVNSHNRQSKRYLNVVGVK
jgi:hypothetical protein